MGLKSMTQGTNELFHSEIKFCEVCMQNVTPNVYCNVSLRFFTTYFSTGAGACALRPPLKLPMVVINKGCVYNSVLVHLN